MHAQNCLIKEPYLPACLLALRDLSTLNAHSPHTLALTQPTHLPTPHALIHATQAVVMAGFRAEEYAMARHLLDAMGAHTVKVLPCTEAMLHGSLGEALAVPEVDWEQPRPPDWLLGGGWGSQRSMLFSGLR